MSLSSRSSALTPRPLRPETSTYGFLLVFVGKLDAHFDAGARREGHHFVREVNRSIRLLLEIERAQTRHHNILQIGLARIDNVENFGCAAEAEVPLSVPG